MTFLLGKLQEYAIIGAVVLLIVLGAAFKGYLMGRASCTTADLKQEIKVDANGDKTHNKIAAMPSGARDKLLRDHWQVR